MLVLQNIERQRRGRVIPKKSFIAVEYGRSDIFDTLHFFPYFFLRPRTFGYFGYDLFFLNYDKK